MIHLIFKQLKKQVSLVLLKQKYLLALLVLLGACTGINEYVPVNSNTFGEINALNIFIQMDQDITLVDKSQEDLTLTVGLLGPLVATGVRGNLNRDDEIKIQKITSGRLFHGKELFTRDLENDLKASGRFQKISFIKDKSELKQLNKAEAVLTLKVHKWGIKTAKESDGQIKSFMDIQVLMKKKGSEKLLLSDRKVVSYNTDNYLSSYQDNIDLLEADIADIIGKTSKKIAKLLSVK